MQSTRVVERESLVGKSFDRQTPTKTEIPETICLKTELIVPFNVSAEKSLSQCFADNQLMIEKNRKDSHIEHTIDMVKDDEYSLEEYMDDNPMTNNAYAYEGVM